MRRNDNIRIRIDLHRLCRLILLFESKQTFAGETRGLLLFEQSKSNQKIAGGNPPVPLCRSIEHPDRLATAYVLYACRVIARGYLLIIAFLGASAPRLCKVRNNNL